MVKGIDRYSFKQRRAVRRRNHVAKDLRKKEFAQQKIEKKKWDDELLKFNKRDWYGYETEES